MYIKIREMWYIKLKKRHSHNSYKEPKIKISKIESNCNFNVVDQRLIKNQEIINQETNFDTR